MLFDVFRLQTKWGRAYLGRTFKSWHVTAMQKLLSVRVNGFNQGVSHGLGTADNERGVDKDRR